MRYLQPHMTEELKDHALEILPATELLWHARLSRPTGHPRGQHYWVHLMWTPIGIVIGGDLLGRGVIARIGLKGGYGPDWFGAKLDEHYLCSKFMAEVWQRDAAIRWCRDHAKLVRDGELDSSKPFVNPANLAFWRETRFKAFLALADQLEGLEVETMEEFRTALRKLEYDTSGDIPPGVDFPLVEAGWLCAIQRKFAELWPKVASGVAAQATQP